MDTCNGNGSCNGSGNPCPGPDGDGDCTESCRESYDDCNGSDPSGSSCNDSVYCNGSDTCSAGSCTQHSGNPCPGPDGDNDCSETCNESSDSCTANDYNGSDCNMYPNDSTCCHGGVCIVNAMWCII